MKWKSVANDPPPVYQWSWYCGIQEGKDIVGPIMAYGDDYKMYYDREGMGHSWMTYWQEIIPPQLPEAEASEQSEET